MLSNAALTRWTADSGLDDPDVLLISAQHAEVLWAKGAYAAAAEIRSTTSKRMRKALGADHEASMRVAVGQGDDARARGDHRAALGLDHATFDSYMAAFGPDDPRTFSIADNIALDHILMGDYEVAHEIDVTSYQHRLGFFGRTDHPWVARSLAAMARDLRRMGRFEEASRLAERAHGAFAELVSSRTLPADHPWVLTQASGLALARRRLGLLEAALELAENVDQRFTASFDDHHPDAIDAEMNLGNVQRALGDATGDAGLVETAVSTTQTALTRYRTLYGETHPTTYTCMHNLALATAGTGDVDRASSLLDASYAGFEQTLGPEHPHTLTCATNLTITRQAPGPAAEAQNPAAHTLERWSAGHITDAPAGQPIVIDLDPPTL